MTLSNYIDYGGSLRLTQPYLAKHVGFFGFALKANVNSLQSLCDLRLNAPAGKAVRFEPSGPFIILAFNSLNQLSSKNPPDSEKGWFSEKEFAVWMPVIDRVQEKSYWFHPYIFVDNPYALALGREVYGFPKSLGVFDIPEKPDASASLSMKTWIIPRYAPDSQGVLTELVKISPVSEGKGTLWSWLEDMEEFTAEVTGMLGAQESIVGDIELAVRTVDDLLHRRAPMVFLKQFPDASHAEKACYMSLVEAPSNMTAFQHGGLLHTSYEVTFTPCDSHPIVSDLGLTSASVEPIISFYVEFDFEIDNGVEIWRA